MKTSHLNLQAKSAGFDRETVCIGSLNLKLRSAYLNSEEGKIIHSPVIAEQLMDQIQQNMLPANSWKAVIEETEYNGISVEEGKEVRSSHEPRQSWLNRFKAGALTLLSGAQYY